MSEAMQESGNCENCGVEIDLSEAWRVNEKYLCEDCFAKLNL
ncbi:MAG: hypothetical protein ACFE9Z_05535 [Promethearchaeota archaeon]